MVPTREVLVAVCRQKLRAITKQRWQEQWSTYDHGKQTRDVWPKPTQEALALHIGLRRPLSAILTQLTTSKIALRAYLGLIRAAETTEYQY